MKLQATLIGIAIVAVGMAISNPSKERYIEYASTEFSETGKNSLCAGDMPIAAQQSCKFLISQGKGVIKTVVENSTKHQNFVLFSLYETDMPDKKITTIAAFGNFYMFK
jgi:molybdopterin-guanine dinucleotide biosynthesis protein A